MKQYIDKSKVVEEIESLKRITFTNFDEGVNCAVQTLLETINTLEVKEIGVDLGDPNGDKSAKYIVDTATLEVKDVNCDKEIGMYTTKELLWKRNKATNVFHLTQGDIDRIAKHFFELGLKAQKGE